MAIKASEFVWHNGQLIPWDDAKIHVMAHVVNYGSSVFEGIRCYQTPKARRSSACTTTPGACSSPARSTASTWTIRWMNSARPQSTWWPPTKFRPATSARSSCAATARLASIPSTRPPRSTSAITSGASIWDRRRSTTASMSASRRGRAWRRTPCRPWRRSGANYMNSQLIKMEAIVNGYSEGIALDVNGYVSEGSGENMFVVHKDRIYTPPLGNSVLPGITRNSVLHIAQELGIPVVEQVNSARDALHCRRTVLQRHRR